MLNNTRRASFSVEHYRKRKSRERWGKREVFIQSFSGCFHPQLGTGSGPQLSCLLTEIRSQPYPPDNDRWEIQLRNRPCSPSILKKFEILWGETVLWTPSVQSLKFEGCIEELAVFLQCYQNSYLASTYLTMNFYFSLPISHVVW